MTTEETIKKTMGKMNKISEGMNPLLFPKIPEEFRNLMTGYSELFILSDNFKEILRKVHYLNIPDICGTSDVHFLYIDTIDSLMNKEGLSREEKKELSGEELMVDRKLKELLVPLNMSELLEGSNKSFRSRNPDNLRQSLVSIRTIFEEVIKLTYQQNNIRPNRRGITNDDRSKHIENTYKFSDGEEITQGMIYKNYKSLCSIHNPSLDGYKKHQVKLILVRSKIIIWFLIDIYNQFKP